MATRLIRAIIESLCHHRLLDAKNRDHALTGDWKGWRDGHIEPDRVLIDKRDGGALILGRTGTHSDLGLESAMPRDGRRRWSLAHTEPVRTPVSGRDRQLTAFQRAFRRAGPTVTQPAGAAD
jgi:addiction module RelE/StbE family toxin